MIIRDATLADVDRLVEMGLRFLRESPYQKQVAENPTQLMNFFTRMLETPSAHVLVAEAEQPVGLLVFLVYAHPLSAEIMASEMVWWVEPEHRNGTGAGLGLLRLGQRIAKESGAVKMQMIAPTAEIGKLYQRLGYQKLETNYQRSL